jgi:DNA polymerase-1
MARGDGVPTNAAFGFTRSLMKLLSAYRSAAHFGVVFDSPLPTFRHTLSSSYKANRPPTPDSLLPQFDMCFEAAKALGVGAVHGSELEADDLIACYATSAKKKGGRVVIVSPDKDLLQLVGPRVRVFDPMNKVLLDEAAVKKRLGVEPTAVPDLLSLVGDAVDNIPGVRGLGSKAAVELLSKFQSVAELLRNVSSIHSASLRECLTANSAALMASLELTRLRTELPPTHLPLEKIFKPPRLADHRNWPEFLAFINKHQFHVLAPTGPCQNHGPGRSAAVLTAVGSSAPVSLPKL